MCILAIWSQHHMFLTSHITPNSSVVTWITGIVFPFERPYSHLKAWNHWLLLHSCLLIWQEVSHFKTEEEVKSRSRVQLFVTPWIVSHQAPWSMGFSKHEYWSGLLFPPGESSQPGDQTQVFRIVADALPSELPGKFFSLDHKTVGHNWATNTFSKA